MSKDMTAAARVAQQFYTFTKDKKAWFAKPIENKAAALKSVLAPLISTVLAANRDDVNFAQTMIRMTSSGYVLSSHLAVPFCERGDSFGMDRAVRSLFVNEGSSEKVFSDHPDMLSALLFTEVIRQALLGDVDVPGNVFYFEGKIRSIDQDESMCEAGVDSNIIQRSTGELTEAMHSFAHWGVYDSSKPEQGTLFSDNPLIALAPSIHDENDVLLIEDWVLSAGYARANKVDPKELVLLSARLRYELASKALALMANKEALFLDFRSRVPNDFAKDAELRDVFLDMTNYVSHRASSMKQAYHELAACSVEQADAQVQGWLNQLGRIDNGYVSDQKWHAVVGKNKPGSTQEGVVDPSWLRGLRNSNIHEALHAISKELSQEKINFSYVKPVIPQHPWEKGLYPSTFGFSHKYFDLAAEAGWSHEDVSLFANLQTHQETRMCHPVNTPLVWQKIKVSTKFTRNQSIIFKGKKVSPSELLATLGNDEKVLAEIEKATKYFDAVSNVLRDLDAYRHVEGATSMSGYRLSRAKKMISQKLETYRFDPRVMSYLMVIHEMGTSFCLAGAQLDSASSETKKAFLCFLSRQISLVETSSQRVQRERLETPDSPKLFSLGALSVFDGSSSPDSVAFVLSSSPSCESGS